MCHVTNATPIQNIDGKYYSTVYKELESSRTCLIGYFRLPYEKNLHGI